MSKAAQLKKKASEYEQKKQYDRALATYLQAVEAAAGIPDELDIPLYNRVGDLYLRTGDLDQALAYYEMAVDLYAEGGFFNNAIALCNKVLRHAPSRSVIYYKLGKISAKKGFNSDAKQNFLEYADRMQKGGDADEAFRALKEFADLCSGQDDVRLMLADQLARVGRNVEALDQLQIVYDTMIAEDRGTEATATLERMRALDPTVELKPGQTQQRAKQDRLVFLDVHDDPQPRDQPYNQPQEVPLVEGRPLTAEEFGEVQLPPAADPHVLKTLDESPLAGIAALEDPAPALGSIPLGPSLLEEPEHPFDPGALAPTPSIVDAPTSLASEPSAALSTAPVEGLEPTVLAPPADEEFVDLQAWLRETEPPKNPRMTGQDETQTSGAVQTDFTDMLDEFKRGVALHVDVSDMESQYDLGVAYMEMGLLDDAIAQFQTAIRGNTAPERRMRAYESLGQCFIERGQYDVAVTSLAGGVQESEQGDETMVGVLYLLGYASEKSGRWEDAASYYQRVFAVDIHFRDVGERLRRARAEERSAERNEGTHERHSA